MGGAVVFSPAGQISWNARSVLARGWFVFWGAGDQAQQELTRVCEPRECVVVVHLVVVHVVPMQVALLFVLRTVRTRFELIYFLQTSAFVENRQVIRQKERSASLIAPPIVCTQRTQCHRTRQISRDVFQAFFSQWKMPTFYV